MYFASMFPTAERLGCGHKKATRLRVIGQLALVIEIETRGAFRLIIGRKKMPERRQWSLRFIPTLTAPLGLGNARYQL